MAFPASFQVSGLLETAIFDRSGQLTALENDCFATICPCPRLGTLPFAGVAQLVEHHVANVVVEGSSPFTRSFLLPPELLKRGQEPIVRSTLRAVWLLVPDPFFKTVEGSAVRMMLKRFQNEF